MSVTLYPAGHILGSAQILIEHDGRRLLYSGDFCPEKTSAAEEIEIPRADTLIMECTYGLPEHKFPPRESVVESLIAFAQKALDDGRTPVCLAYALGKGQEVLRILSTNGFDVAVEAETYRLAKVYERFGVTFGRYRLLDKPVRSHEVVVTPGLSHVGPHLDGRKTRTAAITGWAIGGFSWRAARADRRIPLSDHADFNGLLKYVKAVSPELVYITHGPEEFGYYLKKAGFKVGSVHEKTPSLF
jgi:putative mRNA 3-end processing factor